MKNTRNYTLTEYKTMADKFNKMSFINKITIIRNNPDILTLASDYNWWGVKVKDKEIQEQLEEEDYLFRIDNEWDHKQMQDLIYLLGIGNVDL